MDYWVGKRGPRRIAALREMLGTGQEGKEGTRVGGIRDAYRRDVSAIVCLSDF